MNTLLDGRGLALANMGDITEQTVAGAIQTGTHGTGRDSGGLADQVTGLELVLADGSLVTAAPGEDLFDAARVGLGALGVLTAVTFRVEPAFLLHHRRRRLPLSRILDSLDALTAENEHLDFFWLPHTDACLVKTNNRHPGPPAPPNAFRHWLDAVFLENTLFGAACAVGARLPGLIPRINAVSAAALSDSEAVDTSYKIFTARREVRFLETEYAIPRERLGQALRETRDLIDRMGWQISFPVEVRVTPPSDAWLSTAYGRPSAYVACHIYRETPNPAYFEGVEEIMTRLGGRPHWGKLHTKDAAYLSGVYPRFADFTALRDRLDPDRLFRQRLFGPGARAGLPQVKNARGRVSRRASARRGAATSPIVPRRSGLPSPYATAALTAPAASGPQCEPIRQNPTRTSNLLLRTGGL
ncbi:D-arabinono-1,4-lactone oxidase [Nonomuraea ferruginea]